jgi:hypothetical protein
MTPTRHSDLLQAHERFNRRDVINGAVLRYKAAIRNNREGQFAVTSPIVTPIELLA